MKAKPIVLDSNVLISAALSPKGMAATVVNHTIRQYKIVFCDETFDELQTRLWRPKFDRYITLEQRKRLLHDLSAIAEWVEIKNDIRYSRDIDDDKFIATALAANAEIIVSGDSDLLVLENIESVKILKPADFYREYIEQGTTTYPSIERPLKNEINDPQRLSYRNVIRETINLIVTQPAEEPLEIIKATVSEKVKEPDQINVEALIIEELRRLHEGALARYGLRPSEFERWKAQQSI